MTKNANSPSPLTLVFDTTQRDQTTVAVIKDDQAKFLSAPVRAQELQRLALELLKSQESTLEDVTAVAVLAGPGSFTGVRIGIAAANTLGWLKEIPIFELPGDDIKAATKGLLKKLPKAIDQARARY